MTRLQKLLKEKGACDAAIRWVGNRTPTEAWWKCVKPSWLIFAANAVGEWTNEISQTDIDVVDHDNLGIVMDHSPRSLRIKWCNRFRELVKRPTLKQVTK